MGQYPNFKVAKYRRTPRRNAHALRASHRHRNAELHAASGITLRHCLAHTDDDPASYVTAYQPLVLVLQAKLSNRKWNEAGLVRLKTVPLH